MQCLTPNAVRRLAGGAIKFLGPYCSILDKYDPDVEVVPCLVCDHCQNNRKRMWAYRIMLELGTQEGCFLTLTFNEDTNPMVVARHYIQDFHDSLRKERRFKFFYSGEYGEKTFRPHYHDCYIGCDLRNEFKRKYGDFYETPHWPYGHVHIGDLTTDSACYCAGYTSKKTNIFVPEVDGVLYPSIKGQSHGFGLKALSTPFIDYCKYNGYIKSRSGNFAIPRYFLEKMFDPDALSEWKEKRNRTFNIFSLDEVKQIMYNMKQKRGYSDPVL